jgi:DNA-binding MarR family transcriptional regulator
MLISAESDGQKPICTYLRAQKPVERMIPRMNQDQPPQYPCLCATFRKAGRILTRRYNQHLKPSGLRIPQYCMLANISRNPGISVTELAHLLSMDQTTVTRNLHGLEKSGYIHLRSESSDQRIKKIELTAQGTAKVAAAKPLWENVQREIEATLDGKMIENLMAGLKKIPD